MLRRPSTHSDHPSRSLRLPNTAERARTAGRQQRLSKRVRGKRLRRGHINVRLPFSPPETWHEPAEASVPYRVLVQDPGEGYCHVVTEAEIRERLARLPAEFVEPLEVVQLSTMTRKKRSFPCYGMQWGASLYLYPIETTYVEEYLRPPKPNQVNEARMYGGQWSRLDDGSWQLAWTPEALKDFYLNNILIHELGHLLDTRNSRSVDRERYAEWFAIEYGYQPTRQERHGGGRPIVRRHG